MKKKDNKAISWEGVAVIVAIIGAIISAYFSQKSLERNKETIHISKTTI